MAANVIKAHGYMGGPVKVYDEEPVFITKDGLQYFNVDISPDSDWLLLMVRYRGVDVFNIYDKPEEPGGDHPCIASFNSLDEAVQKYEELLNGAINEA